MPSPYVKRAYVQLAAACLLAAVGISTLVIHDHGSAVTPAIESTASATRSAGLVLVNTSDLSDDGLAQLTRELDQLQALPTTDPESVTPAALEPAAGVLAPGDSA